MLSLRNLNQFKSHSVLLFCLLSFSIIFFLSLSLPCPSSSHILFPSWIFPYLQLPPIRSLPHAFPIPLFHPPFPAIYIPFQLSLPPFRICPSLSPSLPSFLPITSPSSFTFSLPFSPSLFSFPSSPFPHLTPLLSSPPHPFLSNSLPPPPSYSFPLPLPHSMLPVAFPSPVTSLSRMILYLICLESWAFIPNNTRQNSRLCIIDNIS